MLKMLQRAFLSFLELFFHNLTHLCQLILILLWARLYFKRNILWVLILWDSLKFAQVIFQTKQPKVLFEKGERCSLREQGKCPLLTLTLVVVVVLLGRHIFELFCAHGDHRLACFFIHLLCLCVWYMAIYIDVVSSARGMRLESSCLLVQKSTICKWGKSTICKSTKSTICKWGKSTICKWRKSTIWKWGKSTICKRG